MRERERKKQNMQGVKEREERKKEWDSNSGKHRLK